MAKNTYYIYNPETDDYERHYPSLKEKATQLLSYCAAGALAGVIAYVLISTCMGTPSERQMRKENNELRTQYNVLNRRLENTVRVVDRLAKRDDNLYRVIMHMEPAERNERLSMHNEEFQYRMVDRLSDAKLVLNVANRIDQLEKGVHQQILSYNELRDSLMNRHDNLSSIPSILPIENSSYKISSGFGERFDAIYGKNRFHEGVDFSLPEGTPVRATADGSVSHAGREGGYGISIEILHGSNYSTRYANLKKTIVKEGTNVRRGEVIGYSGNTGRSISPHLHYEVRFRNEVQNPLNYCFRELSPEEYGEMIRTADEAGQMLD